MELHVFIAFVIATSVMIALPGPSVLLIVAHSISFGWKRGVVTVAGATMGIAVQLTIAAIGLISLLNAVTHAFEWLRWVGAVYLIYLGIKQWRSANGPLELETASATKKNLFFQGLVITIFNPKSLIFIVAFLPQFINIAAPVRAQFIIIVPTFLLIAFTVTSVWALTTGKASRFFRSRGTRKTVSRTSGGLMIAAGVGLAAARRGN